MKCMLWWAMLLSAVFSFAGSDVEQVISQLPESGEGVFVHVYENGFRLYSIGTAAIDNTDDAEAVLFAERSAALNARQALSEYFSQKLKGERSVNKEFSAAKSISEANGKSLKETQKYSIKEFSSEINTGTSTLMHGVSTLKTIHVVKRKHTYAKVLVCYTSKSLMKNDMNASFLPETVVSGSRREDKATKGKKEEWITCKGRGNSRELAIQAALVEGVRQVYGAYLENDEKYKCRFQKFKSAKTADQLSASDHSMHTQIASKGFVDSYRIIKTELVQNHYEATVHAQFVNPRKGGLKAVMLFPMKIPADKETTNFEIVPGLRMSGTELGQVCSHEFEKAFTAMNKYLVLNIDDMKDAVSSNNMTRLLVEKRLVSPAELAKAGKLLTADFIIRTSFENASYSKKIIFDKKANKFIPKEHVAFDFHYTVFDVKTAVQLKSKTLSIIMKNDEIINIRNANEELPEEKISGLLFHCLLEKAVASLSEDAKF